MISERVRTGVRLCLLGNFFKQVQQVFQKIAKTTCAFNRIGVLTIEEVWHRFDIVWLWHFLQAPESLNRFAFQDCGISCGHLTGSWRPHFPCAEGHVNRRTSPAWTQPLLDRKNPLKQQLLNYTITILNYLVNLSNYLTAFEIIWPIGLAITLSTRLWRILQEPQAQRVYSVDSQ